MLNTILESIKNYSEYLIVAMLIIILVVIVILIITIVQNNKLKKRYNLFMQGDNAKSLENQITEIIIGNKELIELTEKNKKNIRNLTRNQEKCYQKIGLNKYDAFSEMGGKLSFAMALLDENNDGVLINSVHNREGCYSYIKEIKNGESSITLGGEEEKALNQALNK